MARTDRYCREHAGGAADIGMARNTVDDTLAYSLRDAQFAASDQTIAGSADDVADRADPFAEQPCLVVEGPRIAAAAWPPQA